MIEKLVKNVLDTLAGLGESEKVALFHVLEDQQSGELVGGFNTGDFIDSGQIIDFAQTPLQVVIESKIPHTFPGFLLADQLPFPCYEKVNYSFECLCLPLLDEQEHVLGIAIIAQPVGINPPDYRMRTLNMLRTLIAAAMENARLFQLATTDSLTGLYVRRYFDIRLQEELVRIRRHGGELSILLIDVDYFKKVNDNYGHSVGDNVLKMLANLLLESTRQDVDLPCRFGGEEFILLLPNTDSDGASILAERIRQRCADMLITISDQLTISITLSIGIATSSQTQFIDREILIDYADKMLYAAKVGGRNQVKM